MKNAGFTLVELLAIIVVLGIIATLATFNVVKMIDNTKKEQFIADAKEMISKAKYKKGLEKYQDLFTLSGDCKTITAKNSGFNKKNDPDNNFYDLDNSYVKVCLEAKEEVYYVLTSSISNNDKATRRVLNENNALGFVKEKDLSAEFVK